MTRSVAFSLFLIAGTASGQTPPAVPDFETGEVTLGVGQTDSDTPSSKFEEYRDLPNGLTAASFRFHGANDGFQWDLAGRNVQQRDQRFWLSLSKGAFSVDGQYNQIPHNFGNNGHTLLSNTREGVWEVSDTLQSNFQTTLEGTVPRSQINYDFLNGLVSPSLTAANSVDLSLQRERGHLVFNVTPEGPVAVRVTYFRERRAGDRAASGTSFGFGNVVELPEPLHYLTQDVGADVEYGDDWGVLHAGLHYNWFESRSKPSPGTIPSAPRTPRTQTPTRRPARRRSAVRSAASWRFRPTTRPSTDHRRHTDPSRRTRISANASLGRWTQDSTPFIPYTTNTSVVGETGTGATFQRPTPGRCPPASSTDRST